MAQQISPLEILRRTAERVSPEHGVLYYDTPEQKSFLSYHDLEREARAIAEALIRAGYAPGDVAVLGLPGGLEFFRAAFGALLAGLAVSPAPVAGAPDVETVIARIDPIAKNSGARVVLTDAATAATFADRDLPWGSQAQTLVPSELLEIGDADQWVEPEIDEHSLWALLYTSGSTGQPKGVMMTHASLMGTLESFRDMLDMGPATPYVAWMPFHHTAGIMVQVFLSVYSGAPTVLTATSQFQRRPIFWLQLMSEHKATYTVGVNFAFDLVAQLATDEQVAELDLSHVRAMMTGAEPVRMDTIRRFTERFASTGIDESVFMPVFAMTEAPIVAEGRPGNPVVPIAADVAALERGELVAAAEGARSVDIVAQGVVGPHHTLRIVDPVELTALPDGSVGEIWIAGPGVAVGYWQNPTATAQSFGNMLPGDPNAYYRSGDLGAVIDGQVFVTGRLKDVIIFRGRNIYPQDLEASAAKLPGLGIGAAFELTDHPSVVGIVLEFDAEQFADGTADPDATIGEVRAQLMKEFSLPSVAVALLAPGTLPRTAAGKVQRALTRSAIEHGRLDLIATSGFAQARDAAPVA